MKQLKYFILGALTILLAIPVINKLLEVIYLWIDVLKINPSKKILNYEKDTQLLKEFLKPTPPLYDMCDDDYEDFEEYEE